MIIKQVNFSDFVDSFSDTYTNNFTYEGKRALFDYIEQLSDDIGENIELDTVALCCEYTEYADIEEIQEVYPGCTDLEWLQYRTMVIEYNEEVYDVDTHGMVNKSGIIIADF